MNIFVLDKDPKIAATMACDKHVVRMIMETAQMLCTVARNCGYDNAPYKSTHSRHPCTLWAGESSGNWDWLVKHGIALSEEYTERYGKRHKSQDVIEWCRDLGNIVNSGSLTPFAQAMPDKYKNDDAVIAYRNYYKGEKARFAKWKHDNAPDWWVKEEACG